MTSSPQPQPLGSASESAENKALEQAVHAYTQDQSNYQTNTFDLNQDGHQDIVAAGNIYNAEVETVRYDASKGSVLFGDGKGGFRERADSGLLLEGNVKGISLVEVAQQKKLLVVKNNDRAELYSFNM